MALTKATFSMIADAPINVKDLGAVGDGVTNDYAAFAAALAVGGNIYVPPGNYIVDGAQIVLTNAVYLHGASKAPNVVADSESYIQFTTTDTPLIIGGAPSVMLRNLGIQFKKYGLVMSEPDATAANLSGCNFHMEDCCIRGGISSTIGSDTNAYTANVISTTSTSVSSNTTSVFDAGNTFDDVYTKHGAGVVITKSLNAFICNSTIDGFGIGVANWGADQTLVLGSRISSCAISVADHYLGSGAGGSWGSQLRVKDCETLYNSRVPNILLDSSRYVELDNIYYETLTTGESGVFLASQSANFKLSDARFDGVWRTGYTAHPFMLVDNYTEGNLIKDNYYTQYLSTPKSAAPIRFTNTASGNLHKREGFILGEQKTTVFPQGDFSDASNATYVVNFRDGDLNPSIVVPTNFAGFGVEHGASVQSGKLVFWDGTSASKFMAAEMPIDKTIGTLTVNIVAKTKAASADTQIFFGILATDNTGRTVQTIKNGNVSGFNDTTYATVAVTYDMTANDMSGVTKLSFSWQTDDGLVAAIYLS